MARPVIKELKDVGAIENGMVAVLWRKSLESAFNDIAARPGVESVRQVVLVMRMVPETDSRGELIAIRTEFEVDPKLPKSRTRVYSMVPMGDRGELRALQYNEASPDDPKQMTLDEVDDDGKENGE